MKISKRIFAFMFAAVLLTAALTATAAAPEDETAPTNLAITDYNCTADYVSSQIACCGYTIADSGYTAKVTVTVEKEVNSKWTSTSSTWSAKGSAYAEINRSYYPAKGYRYRLRAEHEAYKNGVCVEDFTSYSSIVDLR